LSLKASAFMASTLCEMKTTTPALSDIWRTEWDEGSAAQCLVCGVHSINVNCHLQSHISIFGKVHWGLRRGWVTCSKSDREQEAELRSKARSMLLFFFQNELDSSGGQPHPCGFNSFGFYHHDTWMTPSSFPQGLNEIRHVEVFLMYWM
jgi:hypothetical protein